MPLVGMKRYAKDEPGGKAFLDISTYATRWSSSQIFNLRLVQADAPAKRSTGEAYPHKFRHGACRKFKGEYKQLDSKKSNAQERRQDQQHLAELFTAIIPYLEDFEDNPRTWRMVGEWK